MGITCTTAAKASRTDAVGSGAFLTSGVAAGSEWLERCGPTGSGASPGRNFFRRLGGRFDVRSSCRFAVTLDVGVLSVDFDDGDDHQDTQGNDQNVAHVEGRRWKDMQNRTG